jgi:hypothetical protein
MCLVADLTGCPTFAEPALDDVGNGWPPAHSRKLSFGRFENDEPVVRDRLNESSMILETAVDRLRRV